MNDNLKFMYELKEYMWPHLQRRFQYDGGLDSVHMPMPKNSTEAWLVWHELSNALSGERIAQDGEASQTEMANHIQEVLVDAKLVFEHGYPMPRGLELFSDTLYLEQFLEEKK